MAYRKLVMQTVLELDNIEQWSEAIKYPSSPLESQSELPGTYSSGRKGFQARLSDGQEERKA